MFDALDIGASGLQAQRTRLDTIAQNIANANTTHGPHGEIAPFRRRMVTFAQGRTANIGEPATPGQPLAAGVHVATIEQDPSPFIEKNEPYNPDHDANGNVAYPNIDTTVEFVNALDASRAYEANVTMMETAKATINSTLRLLA
jgi:flagellar basal-body rod protein FlgC